jgi:N-acetylmuramoyl-L-alanine amidase
VEPYNSRSERTLANTGKGRSVAGRRSAVVRPRPDRHPLPRLLSLRPDPIATLHSQGSRIKDPVEKLRFLRRSLEDYETLDERLQGVPGAPLRWLAYRLTRVDDARPLFSQNPNGALDPPRRATRPGRRRRARRAVNVAGLLLVAAAGLALASYPRTWTAAPAPSPVATPLAVAETLEPLPRGIAPERAWLVDSGPGFELYSNGLRIDTTWAVAGEPRRYRVFELGKGMGAEVFDQPVGIVFHTSESDIWPLEESFNEQLRDSSQNLLRYLKRNQVYHYLIDRFGQVFRVVEEKDKANHSGMSVWSQGDRVYLNLNASTIGVAFETRWEGGHALPITRAQLEAGRSLTDYLRDKWGISPDMCVTHGLASVNSHRHLIGHHLDWARGFPFEAFGLPDLYTRPSPAVALFGFGYDEPFLEVMGEPWPGVKAAERTLEQEAAAASITLEDLRSRRQKGYDLWLAEQARDAETADKASAAETPHRRRHASGG